MGKYQSDDKVLEESVWCDECDKLKEYDCKSCPLIKDIEEREDNNERK